MTDESPRTDLGALTVAVESTISTPRDGILIELRKSCCSRGPNDEMGTKISSGVPFGMRLTPGKRN